MSGTKIGAAKAKLTTIERHGADHWKTIGAIGGKIGTTGGFYANRKLASTAGAKGGSISRRTGIRNGEGKAYAGLPFKELGKAQAEIDEMFAWKLNPQSLEEAMVSPLKLDKPKFWQFSKKRAYRKLGIR